MRLERFLGDLARSVIQAELGIDGDPLLRPTQDPAHGDYQLNAAMGLAKRLGKEPMELARPLADALAKHEVIGRAEVAGKGFVNLSIAPEFLARTLESALLDARDGVPPVDRAEKIVVDFSSPNIAKQMHVGHLRSTIIGDSITRLLRFVGHDVIGDNHLGDWGTQYGLMIAAMKRFGVDQATLDASPIETLEDIYKRATDLAKQDEAFAADARRELAKLQSGDAENTAMWQRFVTATRGALDSVYRRLDVHFDAWLGESAYHSMLAGVVDDLLARGVATEDDGAICVFFDRIANAPAQLKKQKEPFIVRKRDGAYLYSTTDIATVLYRRDHFACDRAIYVVDKRQSLHFQQLFAICELLGITMRLEHVGFGMMLGGAGTPLKTREGSVVTLASLLDEAEQRAGTRIREEGLEVPEAELAEVARVVGIGAVKYADLRQNRNTDYQFDWDKMVSFKGNAGPYMQYAYARVRSIFRKGGLDPSTARGPIALAHPAEIALARQLVRFPDVVHAAAEQALPHLVSDHLYGIARLFSSFYEACPVLKGEPIEKDSRLALTALTGRQLARGLSLMGIGVVERM